MTREPNLYEHLDFAAYRKIEAANQSALKHFARSALHVRSYLDSPSEPTAAQALGTAIHAALLEPARFADEYVGLSWGCDRRKKAGKAEYEQALARAGNWPERVLSAADHDACTQVARNARRRPWLSKLLADENGMTEVTLVWDDPETGVRCKCRIDRLVKLPDDTVCVLDPKSTQDASPAAFARDCARYGYHLQAAFYLGGLAALFGGAERHFVFVAVEKQAPFAVAEYELDGESLAEGRALARQYLRDYAGCLRSGEWRGYPDGPALLRLPAFAFRDPNQEAA